MEFTGSENIIAPATGNCTQTHRFTAVRRQTVTYEGRRLLIQSSVKTIHNVCGDEKHVEHVLTGYEHEGRDSTMKRSERSPSCCPEYEQDLRFAHSWTDTMKKNANKKSCNTGWRAKKINGL